MITDRREIKKLLLPEDVITEPVKKLVDSCCRVHDQDESPNKIIEKQNLT